MPSASFDMSLLLNLILGTGLALAFGGAVHFWRLQLEGARRDEMQAMAARRGWALTVTGERLGRAGTLRLVPRGGHPWLAEARPGSAPAGPRTQYESDEPRWVDATLIMVAAPLPEALSTMTMPAPGSLRDLLGDEVSRLHPSMRVVPVAHPVTVLSNGNPSLRVDLGDLASTLTAWAPAAKGSRETPLLILSPEGLQLRLRATISRPDQMERFIDLALGVSRLIGP